MTLTMIPVSGFPPVSSDQFPANLRLQMQVAGVNLGAADISTINVTTGMTATRAGTVATVSSTVQALLASIASALHGPGMANYLSTLAYPQGSVGDYMRYRVNVKDAPYLAKGDGSTDDTAAIQACITANPGRSIFFPPGTYKVTGTIVVRADSTELIGERATLAQYTPDIDTVRFEPVTAGTTTAFLNLPAIRGLNVVHTSAVYSVHTSGAAIRFLQCNGYKLENVSVFDAFEGVTIQGGQLGALTNFSLFAASGSYSGVGSALLHFRQAPVGAGFQACFTVRISNYVMSASLLRETCIHVWNVDGLQASTSYIANGKVSLLKLSAERDSGYIASVGFVNTYFDCVGAGKTPYGIDIPDDGFTNAPIYHVAIGSGCYIGNFDETGIVATKVDLFTVKVENVHLYNGKKWAIDISGTQGKTDIHIVGNTFNSVGLLGTTGGTKLTSGNSINYSGNTLRGVLTFGLSLGGTFNSAGLISGNVNASNQPDYTNAATVVGGLVISANSSLFSGAVANSWKENAYTEYSFTPTITFGGGSTGVTYGVQVGSMTRSGNRAHFTAVITLTSKGSSTGIVQIAGLPVNVNDVAAPSCSIFATNMTSGVGDTMLMASPGNASAIIRTYKMAAGVVAQLTDADFTNTSDIHLEGSYRV